MGEPASGQGHIRNVAVVLDATFHNEQGAKTLRKVTECAQIQPQIIGEDMSGVGVLYEQLFRGDVATHTA